MSEATTTEQTEESFDLEDVYDEEIAPLMAQILEICKRERLPMVASFAYARDEESGVTDFCSSYLEWPGRESKALSRAFGAIRSGSPQLFAFAISTSEAADDGAES